MKFSKFLILSILILYSHELLFAYPDLNLDSSDIKFSNSYPDTDEVIIITATISNAGNDYKLAFIDHNEPFSSQWAVNNADWMAQSFCYSENIILTGVSIYLTDKGASDSLTVTLEKSEIFTSSCVPSGILEVTGSSVTVSSGDGTYKWLDFMFSTSVFLTADTTYWIVAKSKKAFGDGYGWLAEDSDPGTFTKGMLSESIDQGSSWVNFDTRDLLFKTYTTTTTTIEFYDGDPDAGGKLIGTDEISPVGGSAPVDAYCVWTSTPAGRRNIYVSIDPDNYIIESSTADNKAYNTVYVDFPAVTSAVTRDEDKNGMIDRYLLTFSESMDITTLVQNSNSGFKVAGYGGLSVSTASLPLNKIYLNFNESGSLDTGATPDITYSSSTGNFTDLDDGNTLLNITTSDLAETDGTSSKITSGYCSPEHGALGVPVDISIKVTFPEEMDVATTTGAFKLRSVKNSSGDTVSRNIPVNFSHSYNTSTFRHKFVFTPVKDLKNNYKYKATLAATAADTIGNSLSSAKSFSFTTILSSNESNTLISDNDDVKAVIEPGTMKNDFYIKINTDPLNSSGSSKITSANSKLYMDDDPFTFPLNKTLVEIKAYDSDDKVITSDFKKSVDLTISYEDTDDDGIIDGSSPELHEESLEVSWLDENHKLWVKLQGSEVNSRKNTVTAQVSHFTVFMLRGSGTTDLSDAYAFPVPFLPSRDRAITFTNLSSLCTIKIYTLNGELIKEIEHSGGEQEYWEDIDAASGVYLYLIENEKEKKKGKLMIIR
ncbi:Ig-like domain-containing protein [Elusimicrobiota bacterium]